MLWSLIRIFAFIGVVTALAFGAWMVAETESGLILTIAGTEVVLGPLQSVVAAFALLVLVWLALKLAGLLAAVSRFLNGDETALSRYFDRNRERKGYQALADGLLALSSGEGRLALIKADRAERYLKRPELTNLLSAQAAELAGDRGKAEKVYKALLSDERTRFVGVRGLMKHRLSDGDTETAMKLAGKALALKPAHGETQDTLLRLQADREDWTGARKTLQAKLKHGNLPRDVHKRRDAVLALSEARGKIELGQLSEARDAVIEANRLSPDLVPAAVLAARFHMKDGKTRHATGLIRKAWNAAPHPELAAAFADIAPDESREARLKRFAPLIRAHPGHPEVKMLQAELLIAAEDFPAARKALGDLCESAPTTRVLTLMAAVERGEGADDAVVRGWLTRALTAPHGPQWVCDNCHTIHGKWRPTCSNGDCGGVDTLSWTEPPVGEPVIPGGAEMLPLLVGAPTKPQQGIAAEEAGPAGDDAVGDGDGGADSPPPRSDAIADETPDTLSPEDKARQVY